MTLLAQVHDTTVDEQHVAGLVGEGEREGLLEVVSGEVEFTQFPLGEPLEEVDPDEIGPPGLAGGQPGAGFGEVLELEVTDRQKILGPEVLGGQASTFLKWSAARPQSFRR